MDSQINKVDIPNAKLHYKIGSTAEEKIIEFNSPLIKNNLFTLSEYESLELRFESGTDINKIKVESLKSEDFIVLENQKLYCLTDGSVNQESDIIPGIYTILITDTNGCEYRKFYEVTSHNITSKQLELMKMALESKVLGITRNLLIYRKSGKIYDTSSLFIDSIGLLITYYNKLEQTLDYIINNPIEDLQSKYCKSSITKKTTPKSQRWNVTKGERYKIHNNQIIFYEPRLILQLDTLENKYLKYVLTEFLHIISQGIYHYQFNMNNLNTQIDQLETEIISTEKYFKKMIGTYNLDKSKEQLEFEIRIKNKNLKHLREQFSLYCDNYYKLKALQIKLICTLNETWLNTISLKNNVFPTKRIFKNPHYLSIECLYQELLTKRKSSGETPTFPVMSTSQLFEFYNFILCIEVLQNLGFIWIKGWIKDCLNLKNIMYKLDSGEELWFENSNGNKIQLIYDKFLNNSNIAKTQKIPQVVNVKSENQRPDILLNLYDEDTFLRSMIIEVKYRKLKNIYRQDIETDVMKQLLSYEDLRYYNPKGSPLFEKGIVKRILVVYPNHGDARHFIDENYNYEFIPINPIGFKSDIQGYILLENSFKQFLEILNDT